MTVDLDLFPLKNRSLVFTKKWLVWLKFAYFEAPELRREATNLDDPLGIGSLTYIGATATPLIF